MRRKLDSVHLVRVEEKDEHLFDGLGGHEVTLEVDWERRQDHVSPP
jgi:Ser-tRNA(Ala) deacylase AlaX